MLKKSIYFGITSLIGSITLAGLVSLFSSNQYLLTLLYSAGVIIAVFLFRGSSSIKFERHKSTLKWLLLSIILPIIYLGLVYLIGWQFFEYQPQWITLSVLAIIPIKLASSFLEEVGWRAYLFSLLKNKGWIYMNLVIGIIWAIWHYPAIFSGSYEISSPLALGVTIFTFNVILLSFIFGWVRQKTGGIIAPTLIHASHNLMYAILASQNNLAILSESGLVLTAILLLTICILKAWKKPEKCISPKINHEKCPSK